ncbi:uncharacterized protein N7496_007413 [Penicillium cataractarum]|uniref:Uncharacterized protein n=1 Tax=Penicillium cataractarum TaxID=2100454 RepID=A0A9W9V9L0_9EURO|nr:uncharacterized protein N7496_007413 [Penicillium cataractarum]KAJ5371321.1 hypothetical protein N7496_007413 [Penicillium cataractarum]
MEVTTAGSTANSLFPVDKPRDCPAKTLKLALKWRPCQLTVGNELFSGKYRIVLDPQLPRVVFRLADEEQGQVIFTAKNCSIETGLDRDDPEFASQYRDQVKDGHRLLFIIIRPSAQPPMPSAAREEPRNDEKSKEWKTLNTIHWEENEAVI